MAVALLATACDTPRPVPSAPPGPSAAASAAPAGPTIVVTPGAVLFTARGETRQLTATARTADGSGQEATVTWTSSNPEVVSVDGGGILTATAAVGMATVTASVGGDVSPPVYVTVADPVDGAVLLTDEQIASGPTAVDPEAEPAADNPYEVILRGVAGATPGAILINTGEKSVAGRVVSTMPEGSDTRVRLVVVPPDDLFTAVEFADTVDLATGPYEVPQELAAAYDVVQTGNSFTFTPKAGTGAVPRLPIGNAVLASWGHAAPADPPGSAAGVPQGTQALPPLPPFRECQADLGFGSGLPVPLALSAPPSFTFTATGTASRQISETGTQIVLQATPTFELQAALEVKAAFEAKVECKATLVRRNFRVPGWAGLFFGGDVEFGVGFEVGGKVTLTEAKVGGKAQVKPEFSATLSCPTGGECDLTGNSSAETELEPVLDAPSLNQSRFEPSVNLFGFIALEAGNADIDALQFKAIEAKAGVELAATLALEGLQIDNTDEDGRARYELAFKGDVGPGVKAGEFLEYLGLAAVQLLKLEFELPLGESPTGTVKADRPAYLPGATGTVTVTLDADSTVFPSSIGIYNVDRVVVARRDGLTTEVLGSLDATEGQTTFEVPVAATGLVNAEELYAFVVTKLLPLDPPKLEIGPGSFACVEGSPATITSIDDDPDKIYVVFDGEAACRLVAEVGEGSFPGDGSDLVISIDTDPDELVLDAEDTDQDDDGANWDPVGGFGQDLAGGTHTFRSRHVPTGRVYAITVTVIIEFVNGGPDTRMTVQDVKLTAVP